MSTLKQAVKAALPPPALGLARDLRDIVLAEPEWQLSEKGRQSRARLRELHNRHAGERCFIIGNGPSLKRTDLTRLRGEITFGLNRIYLMFEELGFGTTYLVCNNRQVIEQFADELVGTACQVFIGWNSRDVVATAPNVTFFRTRAPGAFTGNAARPLYEGSTVTFLAMQLAYHLGIREVILVGVDHSFVTHGRPREIVVSEGDDPNHFDPRYFGRGVRWELPDLDGSEISYRLAKRAFDAAGGRVVDATIGGKLRVFPRIDYESCFAA